MLNDEQFEAFMDFADSLLDFVRNYENMSRAEKEKCKKIIDEKYELSQNLPFYKEETL